VAAPLLTKNVRCEEWGGHGVPPLQFIPRLLKTSRQQFLAFSTSKSSLSLSDR
jgi:hypothetical protein